MAQLLANNAVTTVAVAVLVGDLTITVVDGSRLPSPTGGDYFYLTLASGSPESAWEVVKVTARSTNALTVLRAQDGTTAQAWAIGSKAELRITNASLRELTPTYTLSTLPVSPSDGLIANVSDAVSRVGRLIVGDGVLTAFRFTAEEVAAGSIYRKDWNGAQKLYATARTNLALYSEQFSSWSVLGGGILVSDFSSSPRGDFSADKITDSGSGSYFFKAPTLASGTQATYSVFIKNIDSVSSVIYARNSADGGRGLITWSGATLVSISATSGATSATYKSVGDGWYRVTITFATTETNQAFRIYPDTNSTGKSVLIWGAQMEVGASATGYIPTTSAAVTVTDYTISGGLVTLASSVNPVVGGALGTGNGSTAAFTATTPNSSTPTFTAVHRSDWQGNQRLYPGSRTNLHTYSEQMDNAAWSKIASSISANAVAAPDGTTTADKMVEDSTNSAHWVRKTMTLTAGVRYTHSIFVKAAERTQVYHRVGLAYVIFDLTSMTILSSSGTGIAYGFTPLSGGWVKLWVSWTETVTQVEYVGFGSAVGGANGYLGDGTSGLYFWGAQLEAYDTATAYIPTTTGTVSVTDYTISSATVTFATAPLTGAILTWTGTYVGGLDIGEGSAQFVSTLWWGLTGGLARSIGGAWRLVSSGEIAS